MEVELSFRTTQHVVDFSSMLDEKLLKPVQQDIEDVEKMLGKLHKEQVQLLKNEEELRKETNVI